MPNKARKKLASKRALTKAIFDWLFDQTDNDRLPFETYAVTLETPRHMAEAAFAVLEGIVDAEVDSIEDGFFADIDKPINAQPQRKKALRALKPKGRKSNGAS